MAITVETTDGSRSAGRTIDAGRIVAVTLFTLLLAINARKLIVDLRSPLDDPLGVAAGGLAIAFYLLLTFGYLRRTHTRRTDRHWWAWMVALLGTSAPFAVPLVSHGPRRDGVLETLAVAVLVAGFMAMLWALGSLGTNISIVPQAREVVTHGPYARVRHPLYTAELVNVLGLCLATTGPWPWAVLVALVTFQVLRARREEALLSRELPGYADYRTRTPMLVPFTRAQGAG